MRVARTQLPGGECRGTPFYILIVEIEPPVCVAFIPRGPPRLGRWLGAKGEGAVPEDRCRQMVGADRGVPARARGLEVLVRPIEGDQAIGSAGWQRGREEGKLEGGPRNDSYEDGITRGPLASTHDSLSVSVRLLAPSSSR